MSFDAKAYAARLYNEDGSSKAENYFTEEDETISRPAFTPYEKRVMRENVRMFGNPLGPRAIEAERAIEAWKNEGGR